MELRSILIRKIPVEARRQFLAACVQCGTSMQRVVTALIAKCDTPEKIRIFVEWTEEADE